MDPGRPKIAITTEMSNPGQPGLETVVRSHAVQLTKLNSELTTAFSQVTGEMGRTPGFVGIHDLHSVRLVQPCHRADRPGHQPASSPGPGARPFTSSCPSYGLHGTLLGPQMGTIIAASQTVRWGVRSLPEIPWLVRPLVPPPNLPFPVALIMSSLTGRALDWAVATVGHNPRLSTDLPLFLRCRRVPPSIRPPCCRGRGRGAPSLHQAGRSGHRRLHPSGRMRMGRRGPPKCIPTRPL